MADDNFKASPISIVLAADIQTLLGKASMQTELAGQWLYVQCLAGLCRALVARNVKINPNLLLVTSLQELYMNCVFQYDVLNCIICKDGAMFVSNRQLMGETKAYAPKIKFPFKRSFHSMKVFPDDTVPS